VSKLPIKKGIKIFEAPDRPTAAAPAAQKKKTAAAKKGTDAAAAAAAAAAATGGPAEGGKKVAEAPVDPRMALQERKREIATLAQDILTAPEKSLAQLRELRELCSCHDKVIGDKVMKLSMMSLCQVFKDIIPGYVSS
jgi:hypothetical protein